MANMKKVKTVGMLVNELQKLNPHRRVIVSLEDKQSVYMGNETGIVIDTGLSVTDIVMLVGGIAYIEDVD